MIAHRIHATLAIRHKLRNSTHVFFWNVNRSVFHRLVNLTINGFSNNLRTTNCKLVAFATHLLRQNCQRQLATTLNFPSIWAICWKNLNRHVTNKLAIKSILNHACCKLVILAFCSSKRRIVNAESHGDSWIVNVNQWKRLWIILIHNRLANHNVINACNCNDIARTCRCNRSALQALRAQKLRNAEVFNRAIYTRKPVSLTLFQSAIVDSH